MRRRTFILIFALFFFLFDHPLDLAQTQDPFWLESQIMRFGDGVDVDIRFTNPIVVQRLGFDTYDLVYGISGTNQIYYQPNEGNNATRFDLSPHEIGNFPPDLFVDAALARVDIDNDDDQDILIGDGNGELHLFIRDPTGFTLNNTLLSPVLKVEAAARPTGFDIDNDDDIDIVVGSSDGSLTAFINTGSVDAPVWTANTEIFDKTSVGGFASPVAIDPNNDGQYDLVVGSDELQLVYLRNLNPTGSTDLPTYDSIPYSNAGNPFHSINFEDQSRLSPFLEDINSDGFLDLFVGTADGRIGYYLNFGFDMMDVVEIPPSAGLDPLVVAVIGSLAVATSILITWWLIRHRNKVVGDPLFLMVVHSTGISPFKFQFKQEIVSDTILAGGAFVSIQSIISEITGAPDLKTLDSGENIILIDKHKFNDEDDLQILLWATADDPNLRKASQNLAEFIVDKFQSNFEKSTFDEYFDQQLTIQVSLFFSKWLEN